MNLFSLSGLIIGLPCFVLGIFTLLKSQKRLHYIWAIFSLSVATWGFGSYIIGSITDSNSVAIWWRLAYVGVILIPATLTIFVFEFLRLTQKKLFVVLTWFIYLVTTIFLFLDLFTNLFIDQVRYIFNQFYYLSESTLAYNLFLLWFFGLILYCHIKLIQSYKTSTGIVKDQIKYILFATIIGFAGGSFAFLPVYRIDIYPILNLTIAISPFLITYAIFRYRFMDLRVLARHVFIYLGSAVFAYVIFYLVSILETKLFGSIYAENSLLFGTLLAITFIFLSGRILELLNKIADKYLFSGLHNYQQTINHLTSQLTYHTDLNEINELITKTIQEIMGIKKVDVALVDPKTKTKDPLLKYLGKTQHPVILEELYLLVADNHLIDQREDLQILVSQMEKMGALVCLPLVSNKRLIGSIILGSKLFNDPFTSEDLELLVSLSSQAGIAIDNAELYKEVKDFNKTLKQKVNEQTMSLQDKTKVLEEQAEHLKKLLAMRSEFLDIASHQLKTPISVISGTISMFKEGSVQKMPVETQNKLIDNIYQKSLKISQIIRDILQASEFDTEKFSFVEKKIVPVDLNKMLTEVITDNQAFANEKKLQLIFTPNPANPQVNSDPDYLEQAIANLVDNALKYTKEGKVEVLLDENPQSIIIKVKDTGVGIPKDDQTRMFGKFERAKNAVDMYTDGSGLGLFITKEIIEAHPGGTIVFASEEGKGTEFTITIPKTKK